MYVCLQSKIQAKKARITELTQENTERLRQLTLLVGENKTLEKALDTRQTSLVSLFYLFQSVVSCYIPLY